MNLWKEQLRDAQHIQDAVEGGEDFKAFYATEAHDCEYVASNGTFVCDVCDKECHLCAIKWLPRHAASFGCRSGGYNHCTCDGCF